MMHTPRSVAICLIFVCGIARAQTPSALTPGSVVYIKERVTVKTKTGIIGLDPGIGVRLVSENGNAVRVTDGTTTFDVPREKVTANINAANVAARNYYATEDSGAQAFNAEVVRQEEAQKRAAEQRDLAAERQASLDAQRQAAERKAQWEAGQKQLARMQAGIREQQKLQTEQQRVQELRELRAEVLAARIEAERARRAAESRNP